MKDRPRALAVLIAVFLIGCIVGTTGTYVWFKWNNVPEIPSAGGIPPKRAPERIRLSEFLELTPEQHQRFREIMAESREQVEALREEQAPKIGSIMSNTNRRLSAVLNEEQRKKFEKFIKDMEDARRHAFGRRGHERPPGS